MADLVISKKDIEDIEICQRTEAVIGYENDDSTHHYWRTWNSPEDALNKC